MTKKLQISFLTLFGIIFFSNIFAIGQNVNMNRWIDLNVTSGEWISFTPTVSANFTPIRVISGTSDTTTFIDSTVSNSIAFFAQEPTMRIYGDIDQFNCSGNNTKITGVDVSHNTGLLSLDCGMNAINFLNLNSCTALTSLVSYYNEISSLDVSSCTTLTSLNCIGNNITSLDVSGLSSLSTINCNANNITNINIRFCQSLYLIECSGNQLSACALDSIFHQLPMRPIENPNNRGTINIVMADMNNPGWDSCRDTIASNRGWNVKGFTGSNFVNIENTNYACPYFTLGIEEIKAKEIVAKVYPNPVSNAFYIDTKEKVENIILYDVLGKEVMRTKKTNDIDVSNLNNGIYILKLITEKGIGEYKIVKE